MGQQLNEINVIGILLSYRKEKSHLPFSRWLYFTKIFS
jgi:hypothetical protein